MDGSTGKDAAELEPSRRAAAFYAATLHQFVAADPAQVLGTLVSAYEHDLDAEQRRAWEDEIRLLRTVLADLSGTLYLEFDVPRLGSRIDAVVTGPAIFPLEFKCGERQYRRAAREQAWDYALDLKNFHQASHHAPILPVLIATDAPTDAPYDHVVIFDEAQRAWNREKTSDFMKRRKKIRDFQQSEPEFLISYLDRHEDWAAIICLVGGGQEIHTGEAGISAWLDAVAASFPTCRIYVSPDLTDSEYAAGHALDVFESDPRMIRDRRLHLASSMRSFRSEKVSAFVKATLDCEVAGARSLLADVSRRYPIAVTRDLVRAKRWILDHARGSERFGLVASSQAQRLKPHAIDVRVTIDPIHWFLNDRHDMRSSYYLEDAATEFQVQGLELDWICVTWDADLRLHEGGWRHHGDETDPTRHPAFYDETFACLKGLGVPDA